MQNSISASNNERSNANPFDEALRRVNADRNFDQLYEIAARRLDSEDGAQGVDQTLLNRVE
ncbi:MAG: hypothetical protein IIB22_03195 [Chloroflexi bacterium]|nr:hypothetical protein [Chloroflexota bacterium]